jgi:hypothetical protein
MALKRIVQTIRNINGFKKRRKPTTDFTEDGTVDQLVDCLSVVNCRQNDCCVILNVHGVCDVRQTEMHTRGLLLSFRVDGCRGV